MENQSNRKNFTFIVAIALFVALTIVRVYFIFSPEANDTNIRIWAMVYNVIALWGALWGLYLSKLWGGYKSVIGRASLIFALGLLAQAFGQNVYNYLYATQGFDIMPPYPGLGDVGFFGSVILYIYGAILLARASGVSVSLKSFASKIQAIIIPLILLVGSYMLFLHGYEFDPDNKLRTFLDFGYPLGQAFYVSIAILTLILSRNVLGGVMRKPILLFLAALLMQYFSDFTFLYQVSKGTFVVGGSVDYMYLLSYFVMAISLIQLGSVYYKIKHT